MLKPDTLALTALLALLTGIGPLSVDMYAPSLPAIATAFGATHAHVQLSISSFLVGFACGQIVYGPVSDRFGRKPVILVALAIYICASLACIVVTSVDMLIASRAAQAVGASGVIVLSRAVVRDLYSGARAGRELSLMGAIMALAPIIAPLIGGVLQTVFGWQSTFILLTAFGCFAAAAVAFLLPETLNQAIRPSISPRAILRSYRSFLIHPSYVAHLGIVAMSYAGLFAWLSGSSFILQTLFSLTPLGFGIAFAIGAVGYLVGTSIATRIVEGRGLGYTMGVGAIVQAVGGCAMVAALAFFPHEAGSLVLPMAVYLAGLGMTMPLGMAGALTPFPERAGTASSLLGFIQQSCAAVLGIGIGHSLGSPWPLAFVVAAAGLGTLAIWYATRGVRVPPPIPPL